MKTLLNQVDDMLRVAGRSTWFSGTDGEVCLRRDNHLIDFKVTTTLDIVNVIIAVPGRGTFTELLTALEREVAVGVSDAPDMSTVYIENVISDYQNGRFRRFLEKRDYLIADKNPWLAEHTPSYYKSFNDW